MKSDYTHPKLRWPIDVRFQSFENEHVVVLTCPIGIAEKPLALVAGISKVLADFNGELSIAELAKKYETFGVGLPVLNELIEILDSSFFLETENFRKQSQAVRNDFQQSQLRLAYLAGLSYPRDPSALEGLVKGYLNLTNAPEMPREQLLGLVAPHIDYQRGGTCYGVTYNRLPADQHDLFVMLGTAHQYSPYMFHLTAKNFQTPLGQLPCASDFVNQLGQNYGPGRAFADEILHKREHSLELQTPFLKHLNGHAQIVPILVGSFHEMLTSGRPPTEFSVYNEFAAALTECLEQQLKAGSKLAIIAGVDMAHVGRQFGDKESLSKDFMQEIEQRDQEYLQAICARDKQALFEHIASDNDARRICGYPSMYLMLDVMERLELDYKVKCFDYQQAVDYQTDCAVTFAGMGFYS